MIRSNFVLAALCLAVVTSASTLADTLVTLPDHIPFNAYLREFAQRDGRKWKFEGSTYRIKHEACDRMLARLGKALRPWDLSKVPTSEVAAGRAEIPGASYLGEMLLVVFEGNAPEVVGRMEFYGQAGTVPEVFGPGGLYLAPGALGNQGPGEHVTHLKLSSGLTWKKLQKIAADRIQRFEKLSASEEGAEVSPMVAVDPAVVSPVAADDAGGLLGMGDTVAAIVQALN